MRTRIFTLLVAFLAIAGNAVWGQETTYKVSFADEAPEGFITETFENWAGDTWSLKDAFIISINGEEQKLKEADFESGFSVEPGSTVSLALKEKSGINPTVYAGYNMVSFNLEEGTNITSITNASFVMPEGNVTIKNIVFEKKTFPFQIRFFSDNAYEYEIWESIEGLDVHYENMDGEIITEALYRDKVRLVLKPTIGYRIESIAKVSRTLRNYERENFMSSSPQDVTKNLQKNEEEGYYYEDFLMPQAKVDTRIFAKNTNNGDNPDGPVTKVVPIDYNLTVSPTPSNGTITFGEDGTQITANYQEQVQVNVTPAEGYHVVRSSLYYTAEGSDEQIPISLTNGVYSFTMPAADVTVHAEFAEGAEQWYLVSVADSEHGTVSADPIEAKAGETINLTITPDEGYLQKELYYIANGSNEPIAISGTSFEMPAADVTVYATFEKIQDDQSGTIVKPIKYYNIYIDTVCPGLNVEVSKDVVQEGHQVSAYLTIQAECDTTGMRFEYKRGLFGYWKDLKELEGVQPGEYIIKNIYTDIYIRALDATLPEEEPTGIEDLEGVKAYAKDGSIYVYTPNREEVTIISMSGTIIKHEEQVGLQSYSVNRGIYIVRIGEKVFKLKN